MSELELTGYLHPDYAKSLSHLGEPLQLENSGGWVISRQIPGSDKKDLIGTYPMLVCQDPKVLEDDLSALNGNFVSIGYIPSPIEDNGFNIHDDVRTPFKEHYLVDLNDSWRNFLSSNHKRNIKRAEMTVEVEEVTYSDELQSEWCSLYAYLRSKHGIDGFADFSDEGFRIQLQLPGVRIYKGVVDDEIAGIVNFYTIGKNVYYHLAAYSDIGYENGASFGIFNTAIAKFVKDGYTVMNLGGGAGVDSRDNDGLARFKQGWSSRSVKSYFHGKVLNRKVYDELSSKAENPGSGFFPLYRSGLNN